MNRRVGYNHVISIGKKKKREWNNCFIKNANKMSRISSRLYLQKHPIFSLFSIFSADAYGYHI